MSNNRLYARMTKIAFTLRDAQTEEARVRSIGLSVSGFLIRRPTYIYLCPQGYQVSSSHKKIGTPPRVIIDM